MPTLALPHDNRVHTAAPTGDPLLRRVWNEYLEMPGLRLTRSQAQRLWAVDETKCRQLLDQLIEAKLLMIGADGRYGRDPDPTSGRPSTARMLKTARSTASRHGAKTA